MHSSYRSVQNGVPQGSVISCPLFIIMINDIFSKLESNIQFSIYADDGILWLACEDMEKGIKEMQYALNSVMD